MAVGLKYTSRESGSIGMGQLGSIHVAGTNAVTTLKSDTVFVAITFLEETTFANDATGLVPETANAQLFPSSSGASTDIDSDGGIATGLEAFPAGITIYGRWASFKLATGKVIAYLGA